MGKIHESIDGRLGAFIAAQHVYFVATAPSGSEGHVNVSPKGMSGTFAVLGPRRVAYLDYFGSGVETIAHLKDNGRIVVMFCAFDGPPNIVRLHGRGEAVLPEAGRFDDLLAQFPAPEPHGVRAIIEIEVTRISDSCGYAVPLFDYVEDRTLLSAWAAKKDEEQLIQYADQKNSSSIDRLVGLPGTR